MDVPSGGRSNPLLRLVALGLGIEGLLSVAILIWLTWGERPDHIASGTLIGPAAGMLGVTLVLTTIIWRCQSRKCVSESALWDARNRQAQADAVLDALGDAVSIQTPDFKVIYQNHQHRLLVDQDAVGHLCYQAYARAGQICDQCPVEDVFKTGQPHRFIKSLPAADTVKHIEIFASPLHDQHGAIIAGIEVVRDLSELINAQREIQQLNLQLEQRAQELLALNKDLEAFSYSLSHDIRSLLTPLILAGEALQQEYARGLDDKGQYLLDVVNQAGGKLERLVEAMLMLSRVGKAELTREAIDLSDLAHQEAMALKVENPRRLLRLTIAPGLRVRGDRELLQIVLHNLFSNAWKYSRDKSPSEISFGLENKANETYFYLSDNGVGFDPERANDLFVPFKRLHNPKDYPGNGVGLATVERIIKRHGGKVFAESRLGEGTTVYFSLSGDEPG